MPAAPGLAMLVPLIWIVLQLFDAMLRSLRAEMMRDPGIVRSGLNRPSAVGPQLENPAIESACVPRSVAPTEMPFLATEGLPTEAARGPELPAANRIRKSGWLNMNSSTSWHAAL